MYDRSLFVGQNERAFITGVGRRRFSEEHLMRQSDPSASSQPRVYRKPIKRYGYKLKPVSPRDGGVTSSRSNVKSESLVRCAQRRVRLHAQAQNVQEFSGAFFKHHRGFYDISAEKNEQYKSSTRGQLEYNKSSAVAEMGDRARAKWAEKWGAAVPLFVGEGAGSPSNTMWPGPRPTTVPGGILIHQAVWPQQTWAEKCGGGLLCPLSWESWVPM